MLLLTIQYHYLHNIFVLTSYKLIAFRTSELIQLISNVISMLLLGFKITSSNFSDLFVFNLGNSFNMYTFTVQAISFFSEILFIYLVWWRNKTGYSQGKSTLKLNSTSYEK